MNVFKRFGAYVGNAIRNADAAYAMQNRTPVYTGEFNEGTFLSEQFHDLIRYRASNPVEKKIVEKKEARPAFV